MNSKKQKRSCPTKADYRKARTKFRKKNKPKLPNIMASLKDLPLTIIIEISYYLCGSDDYGGYAKSELFEDVVGLILAALNKARYEELKREARFHLLLTYVNEDVVERQREMWLIYGW
jgi:hypothetical protein